MSTTTKTRNGTPQKLITLLAEHNVGAEHIETRRGAAVDLHVFDIAGGVRVAKIVALQRDLAVAIGVDEVRIQAPIPGTSYVGIETPAVERTTLDYFGFGVSADETLHPEVGLALPFPVGQQVGNGPIWADLARLPHLLIAGTTGSGKSVAINTLICSLLDFRDAHEVRLHLIDPKRVELVPFAGAPQVDTFATDVSEALEVLADLEGEMDRRYSLFEAIGVRNLDEFNSRAAHVGADVTLRPTTLPRHVIVIDELADLIQANRVEVERVVARLGAVARAAGIHMVLATQRPSVNVVTGVIKGNVPSRWAFTVAAGVDSKVILDSTGAESLYGDGDSLWSPVGTTRPLRVQAVWTSADEVTRAVESSIERHADREILPSFNLDAAEPSDDVEIEGLPDDVLDSEFPGLPGAGTIRDAIADQAGRPDPMEDAVREDLGGLEPTREEMAQWGEGLLVGRVEFQPTPDPEAAELVERFEEAVSLIETEAAQARQTRLWMRLGMGYLVVLVTGAEIVRAVLG